MGAHASRPSAHESPSPHETSGIRPILDALRRIVRELRLSAGEAQRAAGISGAQLFVLQALAQEKAASLSELAARTVTDQSSVSVVVARLVDRKLVTRRPSKEDARRVELSVTPAGLRMLARCPEPMQARLLDALSRMGAAELESLRTGLGGLVREMGIENEAPRMFFEEAAGVVSKRGASAVAKGGAS